MKKIEWISETDAAALLSQALKYFRRKVMSGALPINYTKLHYRKVENNSVDIDAYKISQSSLTSK